MWRKSREWFVSHSGYAALRYSYTCRNLTHLKWKKKKKNWAHIRLSVLLDWQIQHFSDSISGHIAKLWWVISEAAALSVFPPPPSKKRSKWKRDNRRWEWVWEEVDTCSVIWDNCLPDSAYLSCRGWSYRAMLIWVSRIYKWRDIHRISITFS